MSPAPTDSTWWDLHVRASRGEQLSPTERQQYEAVLSQHDQSASLQSDLIELKRLRTSLAAMAQENSQLRARAERLEHEIRELERRLDQPTRELLGVTE